MPLVWGLAQNGFSAGIKTSLKLIGFTLGFIALRTLMRKHSPIRTIQTAALCVIFFNASLWVLGFLSSDLTPYLFETNYEHDALGTLTRFRGMSHTPGSSGFNGFSAFGLLLPLRKQKHIQLTLVLGAAWIVSTFSTFTLLLPILLLGVWLKKSFLKNVALCFSIFGVIFIHWYQPLSIICFQNEIFESLPHKNWSQDNLGPQYMPKTTWNMGPVSVVAVPRVYRMVWSRAFSCLLEHPLGTGVDQFKSKCPITTMNTLGAWAKTRDPHNQYNDGLTAYGFPGLFIFIWLLIGFFKKHRFAPPFTEWKMVVALVFMSGFYGPYLLTMTSVVFFALSFRSVKKDINC